MKRIFIIIATWGITATALAQEPPAPVAIAPVAAPDPVPVPMVDPAGSVAAPPAAANPTSATGSAAPPTPEEMEALAAVAAKVESDTDMPSDEELPKSFQPSYGDVTSSALFKSSDAQTIRRVLNKAERILAVGGTPQPLDIEERGGAAVPIQGIVVEQPVETVPTLVFPAIHVASVVYRGPRDWMIWINGQRVTPKRKYDGVDVISVRPDQVQLSWKADNWEYRSQVWQGTDSLSPQMKKLMSRQGSAGTNVQSQSVYATMRPNQTLVTAIPMLVEGNHPNFSVSITPQAIKEEEEIADPEVKANKSKVLGKLAQDYIDKVAEEKSDEIAKNSAKEAEPKKPVQPPQPVAAEPADPAATVTPPTNQTPAPVVPPTSEQAMQPQTLNDILNAVKDSAGNQPK